ncbi:glycosyltransferase [Limosilactobacillus fermentum]|uniref:glycosyltransferase family 2 protein n=1 Tax=Limosilactobacillus fermentum TaxID=1613 RepID=UPI00124B51EE|nr:glycosyltransferase [Limosilactobacillus fermentum]KAB1958005.1 glycosyltransferase [Limosilactobacillus fermentum]
MNKKASVSVIVPVYNGMPYLKDCLDSLVSQTLEDIEIIIIDDGSTDESGRIADEYADKFSHVQVFHQENKGLYETRKIGLKKASGEYVGWVDADDFVNPTMFEKLYQNAITGNSDLVYCDYSFYPEKVGTKEKWFRPYLGEKDVDFIERNNQPWNKIVKRSLLEELGIGDLFPLCFDEAYIKVLIYAENPIFVNEQLYYYRVGEGSMSSSYTNVRHYENFIIASENLKKEMKSDSDYWNQYFEYRIIYYTLMSMLVAANSGDKEEYKQLKAKLNACKYKKNIHLDNILKTNFGSIKAFAIKNLISENYDTARLLSKNSIRGGTNNNENIAISVVIPLYNKARYIEKTIRSVLDQTFVNYGVIVINDGSTDNSTEKVKQFKDPRIKLINMVDCKIK